jgi:hypothetical protein
MVERCESVNRTQIAMDQTDCWVTSACDRGVLLQEYQTPAKRELASMLKYLLSALEGCIRRPKF